MILCEFPNLLSALVHNLYLSAGLQQMEPATPQAGGGLNREDPSCTSIASSNPNTLAAFKLGAGDPLGARMIEHAWPKIGGQWGMQQEVVQVGQALLECSIQQSAEVRVQAVASI